MILTPQLKQEIYESARAQMDDWYGLSLGQKGACLYWNQVTMRELHIRGFHPRIQAGTMLWQIVPDEKDDGISSTHFGYQWTPNEPFSAEAIRAGLLPEVHIWCSLCCEGAEVIDFSTGELPTIAKEQHGYDWLTEHPPQYIFGMPPAGAIYYPCMEAIQFVHGFIMRKFAQQEATA